MNANIWKVLLNLASDPHPEVASLASVIVSGVMTRANVSYFGLVCCKHLINAHVTLSFSYLSPLPFSGQKGQFFVFESFRLT